APDAPAAPALADVVVGSSHQVELHAGRQERAEALPGPAREGHERAAGRRSLAELVADGPAEPGPDGSVGVVDLVGQLDIAPGANRLPRVLVQPVAQLRTRVLQVDVVMEPMLALRLGQ